MGGGSVANFFEGVFIARRLAMLRRRSIKNPLKKFATERPPIYVCKAETSYWFCDIELFLIEEMRRYFIMGRGRKGLTEQSERKKKASGAFIETFTYLSVPNREIKKYSYLNKPLILWKTWIHNSLSIFFCQTTTTGTLKHRVEMLLEAN